MNTSNWSAYLHDDRVVIESPSGCTYDIPASDTRYTLSLVAGGYLYLLTTKPSFTTRHLLVPAGNLSIELFRDMTYLQGALNQYFTPDEAELFTGVQTKPKKYMRLPNSGTLVYLVDILSVNRLVHGDHNGTALLIKYPIGEIIIACDTIENAVADERALTEYLLSL